MILGSNTLDVLCLQETWLTKSAVTLDIPGYQVFEQRRDKGRRGGMAILVKNGIQVTKYIGNEYSQGVCIQVHGGEKIWVGNVYMPPTTSL
jgi:exonuclease III